MSDVRDPYEVLQVRPEASEDVVRAAFRALARRHHPDSSPDGGSSSEMAWVNWAWEILGNPQKRAAFDRQRRHGGGPPGSPDRAHAQRTGASRAAGQGGHRWDHGFGSDAGRPGIELGGRRRPRWAGRARRTDTLRSCAGPRTDG